VIGGDVRSALKKLAAAEERFSWVFLDPPYVKDTAGVLAELSGSNLLTACAVVIVEHDHRHQPPDSVGCLILTDRRQYGDTELSFYRCSGS
jgi:16S rRNA (guanine966-N2)-methyltransferase